MNDSSACGLVPMPVALPTTAVPRDKALQIIHRSSQTSASGFFVVTHYAPALKKIHSSLHRHL